MKISARAFRPHQGAGGWAAWLLAAVSAPAILLSGESADAPKLTIGPRRELPAAFSKAAPESIEDLEAMEKQIRDLAARVSPAVVAVRVGGATGSGVIISEDGLVLAVAHVGEEPNREVQFIFPDGKTARGVTLGNNHEIDSGLMKITDPGKWPHVTVGAPDEARVGDWVLALGHPGGFDRQRSIVVRLGRLIRVSSGALQSDCTLNSGDSGGPLFDMHGRVIGIHSRISGSTAGNFHVPIGTFQETWGRLVRGDHWGEEQPAERAYIGIWGTDDSIGFRVERLEENGPASKAGLKIGDIVMKLNGAPISDYASFRESVARSKPGEAVTLEIKREAHELTLSVTLAARRWRQ